MRVGVSPYPVKPGLSLFQTDTGLTGPRPCDKIFVICQTQPVTRDNTGTGSDRPPVGRWVGVDVGSSRTPES